MTIPMPRSSSRSANSDDRGENLQAAARAANTPLQFWTELSGGEEMVRKPIYRPEPDCVLVRHVRKFAALLPVTNPLWFWALEDNSLIWPELPSAAFRGCVEILAHENLGG